MQILKYKLCCQHLYPISTQWNFTPCFTC